MHFGWDTIAFPERGRILFQLYDRHEAQIAEPALMFNENSVDFELYAALLFARLNHLVESTSAEIFRTLGLEVVGIGEAQSRHPGFSVLRRWIERFG